MSKKDDYSRGAEDFATWLGENIFKYENSTWQEIVQVFLASRRGWRGEERIRTDAVTKQKWYSL